MTSNKHPCNKHLPRSTRSSRNRTHNKYRNHNRNRNNHPNHKNNTSTINDRDTHHVNVNEQIESGHHHRSVRSSSVSSSESSFGDWTGAEEPTHELAEDQHDETYRHFAWRIAREVKVCRIKDDDNIALAAMTSALPYYTRNTMNLALWIKKNEKTRFTSIKDFIEILSDMEGPDLKPALVYNKCCCQEQQQQQQY
ncbi:hypothetical protein BGX21_005704 [Mortierella sp. AD011]|nr:hypothetical protein BGX21_005704 [Mortierella sp. AD011]